MDRYIVSWLDGLLNVGQIYRIDEAPVAQGIEHRPPEPGARVRVPPGAFKEIR